MSGPEIIDKYVGSSEAQLRDLFASPPPVPPRPGDAEDVAQIAENIASAGEDPAEFIETKLSVSERKYGALPESWRKGFEPARTVRTGKPKFRLVLNVEVR